MNLEQRLLQSMVGPQWARIGVRHHHGINVMLSSLHTQNSCGIGEFYDLIPLIDWCQSVGMDVIQLLPLNDTGDDTSPFFAQSAMALNPLFLSLHKLPGVDRQKLEVFKPFNLNPRVSYHDIQSYKFLFFREYFEEMGQQILKEKGFETFIKENEWVHSFALFKTLKDLMQKNHWMTWPKNLQDPTDQEFDRLVETYSNEVSFYIFLQYLSFQQLCFVKQYAHSKRVLLKGDIPILVSPDSADVWEYKEEFNMNLLAGAPPDEYVPEGQWWGLPTFNWDVMEMRGYDWWKKRLAYASEFYDIYRIDHILGFFRIYAIPEGKSAKEGMFIPESNANWIPHGKKILSVLCPNSPMLPIGEDLGIVPDAVRDCLSELGICGTRVMRWERLQTEGKPYISPLDYNPVSMTTVSTHDSETLTMWWQSQKEEVKLYAHSRGWDYIPQLSKAHRRAILSDSHHSASLFHINLLGEYLALFPELIWPDPFQERINLPGTVSKYNWTYRIRPSVEEMISHHSLAEEVRNLL